MVADAYLLLNKIWLFFVIDCKLAQGLDQQGYYGMNNTEIALHDKVIKGNEIMTLWEKLELKLS